MRSAYKTRGWAVDLSA